VGTSSGRAIDALKRGLRRPRDHHDPQSADRGPARTRRRDAGECVLNLDHEDIVAKSFIGERITTLSAEKLHSVCRALDVATGRG
jgi:hypothetical protein